MSEMPPSAAFHLHLQVPVYWGLIKILFVSPYPTDPEKKALLKKIFQFSVKNHFFSNFKCKLRELYNLNSVILANCVAFNFIWYSSRGQKYLNIALVLQDE